MNSNKDNEEVIKIRRCDLHSVLNMLSLGNKQGVEASWETIELLSDNLEHEDDEEVPCVNCEGDTCLRCGGDGVHVVPNEDKYTKKQLKLVIEKVGKRIGINSTGVETDIGVYDKTTAECWQCALLKELEKQVKKNETTNNND